MNNSIAHDGRSAPAIEAGPTRAGAGPTEARDVPRPPQAVATARPDRPAADPAVDHPSDIPPPAAGAPAHPWRKWLLRAGIVVGLVAGGYSLVPSVKTVLNTVSTDDAYVNGHVTLVAPRVAGLVSRVLVDDNYRVKKGDLLVQLDKEPYQVQVNIKKAAVVNAEVDVEVARSQVRGTLALARSQRWKLQRSMEDVDDTIAQLRARVAALRSKEATLDRARADFARAKGIFSRNALSREDFDQRLEAQRTAEAGVRQALEDVHEARVALGLAPHPENGDLAEVPADLNQNFSGVRQALAALVQTMAQVGLPLTSFSQTPRQTLDEFARRDKEGNLDRIMEQIVPQAPAVRHAAARLLQARSDLADADLNLRYCDVASEIDGMVTRRNVNPGNHIQAGQSVMAVRSLTEIWIDANFKETQLADLRIGHRVRCEVDMYGSRSEYEGRITGFTMGTGQTLALLPPQNATGNFVKIVQRLPVRVELTDYDPDKAPLFVGLSVTPYVYYKEPPVGPHAGEMLQPRRSLPQGPIASFSGEASPSNPLVPKGPSGP
jgi:membrane fusion protein (multidrug efflux system)